MGKLWSRVRRVFTFASGVDTVSGWVSPFLPKGFLVAMAWLAGIAFGLLQGMTPAGALFFSLMCGGVGALLVNQGYALVERIQANRFPPVHEQKMFDLADALAEMKSLVMHPGNWSRVNPLPGQDEHAARFQAARERVDKIAEEVRYDTETRNTAVDFAHLCIMVVNDLLCRRDYREHLAELEGVSGPIFHRLHQGKGIKRAQIPWPQWILDSDKRARADVRMPTIEKGKPSPDLTGRIEALRAAEEFITREIEPYSKGMKSFGRPPAIDVLAGESVNAQLARHEDLKELFDRFIERHGSTLGRANLVLSTLSGALYQVEAALLSASTTTSFLGQLEEAQKRREAIARANDILWNEAKRIRREAGRKILEYTK